MTKSHAWNYSKGACDVCGITEEEYLAATGWHELFCPGEKKTVVGECCTRPAKVFIGGKWVCETCDKNDVFKKPPPDFDRLTRGEEYTKVKKCTCGAKFRGTPDKHYIWCDLEED